MHSKDSPRHDVFLELVGVRRDVYRLAISIAEHHYAGQYSLLHSSRNTGSDSSISSHDPKWRFSFLKAKPLSLLHGGGLVICLTLRLMRFPDIHPFHIS